MASLPKADAQARILERLAEGWSYANAAIAAGIERTTLWDWRKQDPDFEAKCQVAIEAGLDTAEDAIRRHWRRDWRAAHATLVARRKAVYGANQRVEVTGANGGPLEVAELNETERAARVAALLAAAAARQAAQSDDELLS
ncbi:hypothetical protein UFOVP821_23 [uncultured Caudovirales phage]|uniref:Homeodomain phBC6A51-type domain-containing protein n=1 Tax=uncultured Caudovirales phage TaxID=2100421 RepID=A0A6J5PC92_9CAUD|nr:hypothetical protein UFOVP821_23 [uncultured Caudovirales phage]